MTSVAFSKFTAYDRKAFWFMAALGVFALFAYIYFIGLSVLSVVDRKETLSLRDAAGGR